MQIVIVAGGGGTRLWPLSTSLKPKQFIGIIDEQTLLQKTYSRLRQAFSAEQIWVATSSTTADLVLEQVGPEFNPDHIILEPSRRDTFAAECSACAIVSHFTSPDESIIFVPSDDWIVEPKDVATFNDTIKNIDQSIQNKEFDFVTIGIRVAYANPQLGHLEIDPKNISSSGQKPVPVKSFHEKPALETAQKFTDLGNYYWHKHNPAFTYNSLIKSLQKHFPQALPIIEQIYNSGQTQIETYNSLPIDSIDKFLLEKVRSIGMMSMDIEWEDIGNWETVYKNLPGLGSEQLELEGQGNKVKLTSNKKVAFVGVSGLLLVETEEGILVIDPAKSAKVKEAAEYFKKA